jgi:hypothetical protein
MQRSNPQTLNPQATECEKAYLAGLWDGEGTITIREYEGKAQALLKMANTDVTIIAAAVRIIERIGASPYVVTQLKGDPVKRDQKAIIVTGMDNITKVLNAMMPYLTGKQGHAYLVLRWIKSRTNRGASKRGAPSIKVTTNDEERYLIDAIRDMNTRGASTTARAAAAKQKIQSDLHRDMQSMAEMTMPRAGEYNAQ